MADHEFDASSLVYGDEECGICLQHYRRGHTVVAHFPCKHHLHAGCFQSLLATGYVQCPSDRTYKEFALFHIPNDLSHVRSFRLPEDDAPAPEPLVCSACQEDFSRAGNRRFKFAVQCGHAYHSECVLAVVEDRHCYANQCNAALTAATDFVQDIRDLSEIPVEREHPDVAEELMFDMEMD